MELPLGLYGKPSGQIAAARGEDIGEPACRITIPLGSVDVVASDDKVLGVIGEGSALLETPIVSPLSKCFG